jgi:hypothetical protein
LTLTEDSDEAVLEAIDASNNQPARMTTCDPNDDPNGVWAYTLCLPHAAEGVTSSAQPYQDDEGLVCEGSGWVESRFDFWRTRRFNGSELQLDASDPNAFSHEVWWSADGQTWSSESYLPNELGLIPNARWLRIVTSFDTGVAVYLRDMRVTQPEGSYRRQSGLELRP